jgi:hypothetical protein
MGMTWRAKSTAEALLVRVRARASKGRGLFMMKV